MLKASATALTMYWAPESRNALWCHLYSLCSLIPFPSAVLVTVQHTLSRPKRDRRSRDRWRWSRKKQVAGLSALEELDLFPKIHIFS